MTTATAPRTLSDLAGTYAIDPAHSRVGFVARHAMVTKVRGAFNDVEGTATVGADLADARVDVTIRTASLDTRNEQRDGHVKSGDFLAVEEYPTITFVSTSVRATSESDLEITGDLTIKGVTKSVTVPFEFAGGALDPFGNERIGFDGGLSINRSDFGITWNAALETGGVLVSDKITLEFEISAIKTA